MRLLERLSLIVFSLLILVLSVIICLLTFGIINLSTINVVFLNILNNNTYSKVMLGIALLFILLSLKNIFFGSKQKQGEEYKDGVLLQNDNGKLLISKETLENLVSGIAQSFEGTQNVTTRVVLDKENNISVHITLYIREDAVIKDLSLKLQKRIKEAIKSTSDLDVKEVNIQIKNIAIQERNTSEQ